MGLKTRVHGSFNLVPVLIVKDDVAFIDFEGESHRATAERHRKVSPLRDIASMLRSFDYAARSAIRRIEERDGTMPPVRERALAWRDAAIHDFLAPTGRTPSMPASCPRTRRRAAGFSICSSSTRSPTRSLTKPSSGRPGCGCRCTACWRWRPKTEGTHEPQSP